ncbi:MAG: hypothetical protein PHD13_04085 [Methanocellales archaeon]|nr:hypothetical protein [Methanocellales archaeon]MDD3292096.1 hypothetical protein [Methanocellales archaeon]MDD5235333.1 hypothetical protein [Methanocellales archaeon]MDD5485719.1 hypothetical protein [Methanocellales archaeon]
MVADKTKGKKEEPIQEAPKRENNANRLLVIFTAVLAISTVMLVILAFQSNQISQELASITEKSNQISQELSNITEEFYEYHPPKVSVIYGSVLKLYVLNNSNYETCLTIVGISQVYNSGTADDDAFVRQQYWGLGSNTTIERDLGFSLIFVQEGEVIQRIRAIEKIDARLSAEGSPYPIPVRAGGPAVEIPILLTSSTKEKFKLNSKLNLTIGKDIRLEIIDPINKNVTANESAFIGPANITYVMGETTAKMETSDGRSLTIDVRYTEDVDTYKSWKQTFLFEQGIVAPVLIDPKQIEV